MPEPEHGREVAVHGTLVPEVQARVAGALRPVLRRWL